MSRKPSSSLALVFFALIHAFSISAQDGPSFRLGLKVAPNMGSIRAESEELEATDGGNAISYGLLGEFPLGDRGAWWISTGMIVTNIHGSFTMDATVDHGPGPTDVDGSLDMRTRYLELPATLKWRSLTAGPLDVYVQLGVSGACHLRSSVSGTRTLTTVGSFPTTTEYDDQSTNDDMRFMKYALMGGAGLEYTLGSGITFFGGVTYSSAISSALENGAETFVLDGNTTQIYPDYLEVALGVFF